MNFPCQHERLYVGGEWVVPDSGGAIPVICPTTEQAIGTVPAADAKDVDRAVSAAREAFDSWSAEPARIRSEILAAVADALEARTDELVALIARDVGMPRRLGRSMQVELPIAILRLYAKLAVEGSFEERVGHSVVIREPVGVVGAIMPWNYPLFQLAIKAGPALACGCTVVAKPSEVAPLAAFEFAHALHDANLPPGVFNLVTGYGAPAGEALVSHPQVDAISFTGSTATGRRIAQLAADRVTRITLELGGKSASVVLDDADLRAAVRGTVNSCFLNSGQTCLALTRLLVHADQYEQACAYAREAAERMTLGDPDDPQTKLGPLASAAQRDRVERYIRIGLRDGAELVCGGAGAPAGLDRGYFVQPTIFGRVEPRSTLAQEEIFGPVLVIIPYSHDDEAVAFANGTPYGLSGAVWSASLERAQRIARRLRTGQVDINGAPFNLAAPLGGFKQSGYGRELGRFGFDAYLEYKALQLPRELTGRGRTGVEGRAVAPVHCDGETR
jgi:betaine-aldehyde dehydrogenase